MKGKARRKKKDAWFLIGIVGCIGLMILSAWQIRERTKDFSMGDKANDSLQNLVVNHDTQQRTARPSAPDHSSGIAYEGVPIAEMNRTDLQEEAELKRPPKVQMTEAELGLVGRIDMVKLTQEYPAAAGWIYQPDTVIDYPVMHGEDNRYYLTHLYDGSVNRVGSIFMDYRNAADFSDSNSILYGHHMRSGKMFASITGYKEQEYFDAHPVVYLYKGSKIFRVELVAGYVVSGRSNDIPLNYDEEGSFEAYRDAVYEKNTFVSGINIERDDYLLTMATCTYDFQNARYVLLGRMLELVETDGNEQ